MEVSALKDFDLYLYHQGTNFYAYQMLGAHFVVEDGVEGVRFAVWAPHAKAISVVGDFNNWDYNENPMQRISDGEIWVTFIPNLQQGEIYKYSIEPFNGGERFLKADPYAFYAEKKPKTASRVYDLRGYEWHDEKWQKKQQQEASYDKPMLIYEVHLGSWRRDAEGNYLTYREAAKQLISYVKEMNYTHIEFMPLCEHPFDGSWGYQATGYYAVTSRYGEPKDFMYLVDLAHQNGIAVIMDWVPGHFCNDAHGLRRFDGETLYESDNEKRRENWQWGTTNFDYGRREVHSFLISNALFWLNEYHIDGLRIDAVANMLYLNYGREEGQWEPNKYGDTGNLEAMELIKNLNEAIFKYHPNALMMAEESTSWPMISRPTYMGGMGFNYKWNMGWMNDMLKYMALDPIDRAFHHDMLTFSFFYAFSENFILPISHDEVVHGKASLVNKMYGGDIDNKFKQCKLFMAYMMAHPGKKLLFMGADFAQFREWDYENGLEWFMVDEYENHRNYLNYSKNLNHFYLDHPQFWERDFSWEGFSWISNDDFKQSIIIFRRFDKNGGEVIVVCNFVPVERKSYCFGVPYWGSYTEVFNSSSVDGSPCTNGTVKAVDVKMHGFDQSVCIDIPAFSCMYFTVKKEERPVPEKKAEGKKKTKTAAKKTAVKKAAKAKTTKKSTAKKAE